MQIAGAGRLRSSGGDFEGLENGKERKMQNIPEPEHDRFVRWRVVFITLNILGSIACMVFQLQLSWQHSHYLQPLSSSVEVLRNTISGLTVLLLLQMTELAWYRHINSDEYLADAEDQSSFGFLAHLSFWVELAVCALHQPPAWTHWSVDETFQLCVLLRLYWLLRLAFVFSAVYRMRRSVQQMVRDNDAFMSSRSDEGVSVATQPYSTATIAKVFFSEHAWSILVVSTLVVFLAMSYAVYVCERAEQPDLFTFGNAVYFTATMITTIGSSFTPNHPFGRTLSLIASLVGVAFLSLSVVVLLDTLRLQGDLELACMDSVHLIKADRERKRLAKLRTERLLGK